MSASTIPWLVLPFKSFSDGKSRLAPLLSGPQRRALNLRLLKRSLALARAVVGVERTVVVSRCAEVLSLVAEQGAWGLAEECGAGLNEAVAQALAWLQGRAGAEIIFLSCDLPLVRPADLHALVACSRAAPAGVALATDRAGSGTNALCLPPGASFRFFYGPASRRSHAEEAARRGLPCRVLHEAPLAFDIDTIADWHEWQGLQDSMMPLGARPEPA